MMRPVALLTARLCNIAVGRFAAVTVLGLALRLGLGGALGVAMTVNLRTVATIGIVAGTRLLRTRRTLLALLEHRLSLDVRVRRVAVDHHLRNLVLDESFDVAQEIALVDAHQ